MVGYEGELNQNAAPIASKIFLCLIFFFSHMKYDIELNMLLEYLFDLDNTWYFFY